MKEINNDIINNKTKKESAVCSKPKNEKCRNIEMNESGFPNLNAISKNTMATKMKITGNNIILKEILFKIYILMVF